MFYAVFTVLLFTVSVKTTKTIEDIFTSVKQLEMLIETQQKTIEDLEMYVVDKEERLSILKRYLKIFKREHSNAKIDIPEYIGNPINAYKLIRRLTADLNYINSTYSENVTMKRNNIQYPTKADLTGAAQGLARLQNTYRLKAEDLAKGIIGGVNYGTPMTASDCYEVGRALYDTEDFKYVPAWMLEAYRRYDKSDPHNFTDSDILDYFYKSCLYIGYTANTLELMQNLSHLGPKNEKAYDIVMNELINTKDQLQENGDESHELLEVYEFEDLCRDDWDLPEKLTSRLTCRYLTENHPFLLIAPLKIEMLHLQPDVVLFHNILSDSEIEALKEVATPHLERGRVLNGSGIHITAEFRISKTGWMLNHGLPPITRVLNRVKHMTGLSLKINDGLHIINYGIAGYYAPHFDFFIPSDSFVNDIVKRIGNRIATIIFYLSDVDRGGHTVFTNIGLKVPPVKGTAILFYNLLTSGYVDGSTRHAACPVLYGTKWVATKWLYEVGQELIRPCKSIPNYVRLDPSMVPEP